jgi:DNA repair exonuclease SbcCD ATPase subunit
MKKVTLKSLTLTNFRGEKSRTTEFGRDTTTIAGDNGLGKSRHFDAFCWLLFGKDALDRKDYEIRTVVNGEPLHRVECGVTGVLDVSGETVILKRMYVEKWVKPRGQVDEVFKGNETETYWNDVPVNVGEYQKRISEIIPETVFKMVTNPMFFATQLKWQEQREQLFRLAGTVSDTEIASQKPEFAALLDRISGKSLADFKAKICARKKRLKSDLAQIQPKIEQTHRLMPKASDFEALENGIDELDRQISDIDRAIADKNEAARQQFEAAQNKQSEINALREEQQRILFAAKTKAREDAFAANAARSSLENEIKRTEGETDTLKRISDSAQRETDMLKKSIDEARAELDALRKKWADENAKEHVDEACPYCKQVLPEDMKASAREMFDESKAAVLDGITEKGKTLSGYVYGVEKTLEKAVENLSRTKKELEEKQSLLAELQTKLDATPVAEEKTGPEALQKCAGISTRILEMEKSLHDVEPANTAALQAQKRELSARRDSLKSELRNRDLIAQYTAEIGRLEAQGKELAQQIADAEKEEYIMQQFTKARTEECERRINGLFGHVTFKLFDYTIEGNESETCIPLVNGVPFGAANTAGQINAGLDIINALVKLYGVCAPIFIDRRESVNRLIKTEGQTVSLVVSNDSELIIK